MDQILIPFAIKHSLCHWSFVSFLNLGVVLNIRRLRIPRASAKSVTVSEKMVSNVSSGSVQVLSWKGYLLICASNEDSDQPAHPRSLIWVFALRIEKLCILGYLKCAQRRFWSDCANAQADLNLRWAHMPEGPFSDVTAGTTCIKLRIDRVLRTVVCTVRKDCLRIDFCKSIL